jgi:Fur family ferric uptake transcriptional regulator
MPENFSLRKIRVKLSPQDRFAEFLQRHNKRMTQQRRLILETIFSHHDHFDADELIGHLQELIQSRQVSRPTVYRTLAELVEAGILRKMALEGRSVYEHDYGYPSHDHLHCEICNKLIEFHSQGIERLCDRVANQHNFQVLGHRLFITGICEDCRKAGVRG